MKIVKLATAAFVALFVIADNSAVAARSNFSFLPRSTEQQKLFKLNLDKQNWAQAMSQWDSTFKSSFKKSADGYALYDLLLFKTGAPTLALEKLFLIRNPKIISRGLRNEWSKAAPLTHWVWDTAEVKSIKKWKVVFPSLNKDSFPPRPVFAIKSKKQLNQLGRKLNNNWLDEKQRVWILWQLALWKTVHNYPTQALKIYNSLLERDQTVVSQDEIQLAMGRAFYQLRKYSQAVEAYTRISKGSDLWVEAVEERAYAFYRLNQADEALADLQTLKAPILSLSVGPEPYFLESYIHLKSCNYPAVFKTTARFKKNLRSRVSSLQQLANKGQSTAANKAMSQFATQATDWKSLGADAQFLPRLFHHDRFFARHANRYRALATESRKVASPAVKAQAEKRAASARKAAMERLTYMAKRDLRELKAMLQKLHLVEAEVIQRIHIPKKVAQSKNDIDSSSDVLIFPANNEVWLDELDNYQVNMGGCMKKGEKVL